MKTNKEKYTNTDDALAAWKKHREECKCDCKFESWLKQPCDEEEEEIEKAANDMPRGLGLALAGLVTGSLVADAIKRRFADAIKGRFADAIKGRFKDEKPKDCADGETDGLKCPLCGGEHGRFGMVTPIFICPDCGAAISKGDCFDIEKFREWYSGLTK